MRPRKKDKHLPECVYHHHGAYWLVKKGVWTRLGKELPKGYTLKASRRRTAMTALIDTAMETIRPNVTKSTWGNYTTAAERLKYAFQDHTPQSLTAADIWEFRDGWAGTPNMTNRCLSLLTQILNYAVRRRMIPNNPAIGIDKHGEKKRDRLITRAEYVAIYEKAGPRLQCIMDLLYLTGQRVNDVLTIRRDALTDEGLNFKQQKTGKKLLIRWTPELREAVERTKALSKDIPTLTLLSSRYRKAPDYRSINLQWKEAREAAGVSNAQLRDLRAMSLTSAEDEGKDSTALAGHSSKAMTQRYLRGKKISKVDGPSFG